MIEILLLSVTRIVRLALLHIASRFRYKNSRKIAFIFSKRSIRIARDVSEYKEIINVLNAATG